MKRLRKMLAVTVMSITVISMSMLTVPFQVGAAAKAGDLIKMNGLSSVYSLGTDGKRYVFPNQSTYFSWYSDWSKVVTVSQSELESYPLGANVTVRPGTKLVKITTNPTVYAVEPGGVLRSIVSEANAIALYGKDWAKKVIDVPDGYFTNYKVGTALTAGVYPAGSLVKSATSADVYYFDGTNNRKFADEAAFVSNRFDFSNVVISAAAIVAGGIAIAANDTTLSDTTSGAGGTAGSGTGLTVALASDTAVSTNVIGGQAIANMVSFKLTAANDGAVTVKSIKLKRVGISSDSVLSSIYLYEGNTKLTDAGSLSSGYVTFSGTGLIIIPAGQTKTISVKADIAGVTGNVGLAINAVSDVVTDGATIVGAFPVNGNQMSAMNASDLAKVAVGAVSGSGNVNAGTVNTTLWSAPLTITDKSVNFKYVSFRQLGSIASDSIQNLKLYVNGIQTGATSTINSSNRVVFDLTSAPVLLDTGNRTIELRGDIVKGSNSTFSFSLQVASDIELVDSNYGVNVTASSLPKTTGSATINSGNLVIAKDQTFSTTQVVKNASNVTLAKYTMKAYGEDMKITTLNAAVSFNGVVAVGDGVNNLSVFVNGEAKGTSQSALQTIAGTFATTTKTYGTTNLFTISAGQTVTVEVKGTLVMNSALTTATTITTNLAAVAGAYQGVTSFANTPVVSTSYGTSALTIVSTGLAILSKNNAFASVQTISSNVQKQKIGSFVFQAGSSEAVRATNVAVKLAVGTMGITDATNLYISETPTNVIGSPVATPSANNFPVDFTLQPGQTKTIDVFADVALVGDNSTLQVSDLAITARTVTTTLTVEPANIAGQTLTFVAGFVATPVSVSADAPSALVVGGSTGATAAVYKFVATNGAATLSSLKFKVYQNDGTTPEGTAINSLTIGSVTAPVVANGSDFVAFFDKTLNISVPVSTIGTSVTVTANYNTVGTNNVTTRTQSKLKLTDYRYQIGSSVPADVVSTPVSANTMLSVASKAVVDLGEYSSNNTVPASRVLSIGTQEVLRFKVVAQNGSVNFKQFAITPVFNGAGTIAVVGVYDLADLSTNLISAPVSLATSSTQYIIPLASDSLISTNRTYVVKVSVGTLGAVNTNNLTLSLTSVDTISTGTNWQWNDTTVGSYGNGYLLKNLPVNGYSFNY
ncbi:hypothetical protein KKG80_01580 [Patescibacteria group bacterium]|nr:hypothetical protein [Patescibacteria group bacterium]